MAHDGMMLARLVLRRAAATAPVTGAVSGEQSIGGLNMLIPASARDLETYEPLPAGSTGLWTVDAAALSPSGKVLALAGPAGRGHGLARRDGS